MGLAYTRNLTGIGARMMARTRLVLEPEEAYELSKRLRASTVSVRDRQRAQIILLAAEGRTRAAIGETIGVTRVTVNHWCRRFAAIGWRAWRMRPGAAASLRCRSRP